MKESILNCVSKGGVSFVELSREVPGFNGDNWLRNDKNMVYWSSISDEAAQALLDLEMANLIKKVPCHPIIYMVDGGWMDLPMVKQDRTYKNPHWLPVTYSLVK
jgi:hypothetical protein